MSRVIVVGSGIAGLSLALDAADAGHEVTVVTKGELGQSNTRFAQGGVAAAVFSDDSVESHISDTLAAGAGLCDPEAVRVLCSEGPARIRELIALGVAFDMRDGELAHGLEAAHSYPRILHAGGDATGAVIEAALVARLREREVVIHENAFLLALRTEAGPGTRVAGIDVELDGGARVGLDADAVVLATGGAGQLYPYTSNPPAATGDGVACAARIGAQIADVELYQFHPTTLARPGNFLISEAVRGEGAVLRNAQGERFMEHVDGAELAPRDVVARAVFAEMTRQGGVPVTLDATALGAAFLAERFPSIDAAVRAAMLDWSSEPIPITPAAHYWMGGIVTDLWGRTSVPGLFAIGECARTGVHGANRLASNSLLEGAVFGHRAAQVLRDLDEWPSPAPLSDAAEQEVLPGKHADTEQNPLFGGEGRGVETSEGRGAEASEGRELGLWRELRPAREQPGFSRAALQELMWGAVGVVRDGETLAEAIATLAAWDATAAAATDRASHEDANLLLIARLCASAAAARQESVGAHFRSDDPATAAAAQPVLQSV